MTATDPYEHYLAAGTSFSRLQEAGSTDLVYAIFNEDRRPMLPFVDTGLVYCGEPSVFKYFHKIKFQGKGKLYLRVLVENTEVSRGWVTLSEDAYQASTYRLPRGCAGYGIRLQMAGIAWWRYYEIIWDPVSGEDNK